MDEKQLNDKREQKTSLFETFFEEFVSKDDNLAKFILDDRAEDLLNNATFKDAKKDPLFDQLIEDPNYKKISHNITDGDGIEEDLDLSDLIRDFYGEMRFGESKKKYDSFVFTCTDGEQCLIQQPDPDEIDDLMQFVEMVTQKVRAVPFGDYLVTQCWLSGDDEIRKDKKLYHQIGMSGMRIVNVAFAHVKKN
jgi:hypothetical protein